MPNPLEIRKNAREVIRIERQDFRGHDLINLRVFFDAGDGEMKPAKQGVAFRAALLPDVISALSNFTAEVEVQS